MDQKLDDFKEDVEALVKQYWGGKNVVIEVRNYGNEKLVIIIQRL